MEVHENINLTRRKMIRFLGWFALVPLAGIWGAMVNRKNAGEESSISRILLKDIPPGNSYFDDYYIIRKADEIKVFSTRCTHLGCKLRHDVNDQLVCPCHGSAYNSDNGRPVRGPAVTSLEMLNFMIKDDYLLIYVR